MNVDLGVLKDGGVLMVFEDPPPDEIKRVELYREEGLVMLVFRNPDHDSELMNHELPENMMGLIEQSPNIMIFNLKEKPPTKGYKVPLVKVGNVY